ncbi:uncharacterized protein LOC131174026 [Hevea brasiliensis]|uniref:uncharacterized protein LOC131174026 n=1 Tax=Hevea brasiliensis TaxID=3981 RepID=UPI0025EA9667|nr:uncharacterized protein LOC131174026 [Hevea brasiliensis]
MISLRVEQTTPISFPDRSILHRRGIPINPSCPICAAEEETIEHTLFWCNHARATWFVSANTYKPNLVGFGSFSLWWSAILNEFCEDQLGLCFRAISYWIIWKERNLAVFDHIDPNPIATANRISKSFFEAKGDPITSSLHDFAVSSVCSPPPVGTLKLNSDVAWRDTASYAAIAVVLRNHERKLLDRHVCLTQASSPLAGAAKALLQAIQFAQSIGAFSIILEMDCSSLFETVCNLENIRWWKIRATLLSIKSLLPHFHNVSLSLVKRSTNRAADFLAKSFLLGNLSCDWLASIPSRLSSILYFDSSSVV